MCGKEDGGGLTVAKSVTTTGDAKVCRCQSVEKKRGGQERIPFISLFMITPVSGTMMELPKIRLMVVVSVSASPDLSAVTWRCQQRARGGAEWGTYNM